MISYFLPDFNGVAIYDYKKVAFQMPLDACLQGLGLGFCNLNIVQLEMINILVALKLFCNP